jgi:hypothetical protein
MTSTFLTYELAEKFGNCAPEISKFFYGKLYGKDHIERWISRYIAAHELI